MQSGFNTAFYAISNLLSLDSGNNIVLNAIKYNLPNGKVEILVKGRNNHLEIKLTDTGVGIPKEELPKIFDLFYRGKYARQMDKTGAGIGLTLVKNLVEMHGGRIDVESMKNRGTTFILTFPRVSCPATIN